MKTHMCILKQLLVYYSKKNFTPQLNIDDTDLLMSYFKKYYINNFLK
jgi:hypothetical protein